MAGGRALLAAPALALTATAPLDLQWFCALGAVIVLGIPHGALDGEVARTLLRPRLGRAWLAAFAIPYLALSACVLLAWRLSPLGTLAAFLAASVWHFGTEDSPPGARIEAVVRGGLPIAVPVLVHPAATALVFGCIAQSPLSAPPAWLFGASLGWLALACVWISASRRMPAGIGLGLLTFAALPPLTAFAVYFVCVHAPAHVAATIADARRAPRVHDRRSAALLALPWFALTVAIGAALWPLYDGAPAPRLLALVIQGLAALTLPHMLLDASTADARPAPSPAPGHRAVACSFEIACRQSSTEPGRSASGMRPSAARARRL